MVLRTTKDEVNNDGYYQIIMPSRIMPHTLGVKPINLPAKLLSPHPKTLQGDGFGWA